MQKRITKFLLPAVLTAVAALAVWCCDEPAPVVDNTVRVSVRTAEVGNESGQTFVSVKSGGSWTLSLEFEEGVQAWAELSAVSGTGEKNDVILTYEVNETEVMRIVKIVAGCGLNVSECTLTQAAGDPSPVPPGPELSHVPEWLELPAVRDDDGLDFYWHDQVISGKTMRSWSFDYDPQAMVSHWVAYPLNKGLIGNGSRTECYLPHQLLAGVG